jgi:hypothetical protein
VITYDSASLLSLNPRRRRNRLLADADRIRLLRDRLNSGGFRPSFLYHCPHRKAARGINPLYSFVCSSSVVLLIRSSPQVSFLYLAGKKNRRMLCCFRLPATPKPDLENETLSIYG